MAAMDALTQVALAGTARAAGRAIETGTPLDELLGRLPDGAPERRLLLAAGALAVYRQAGHMPRPDVAAPEPAPEEHLPACSPGAARLIGELLAGQHAELLPEALERLRRAGRRLSPELLPTALTAGARSVDLRPAVIAVMGERGHWLARHNPDWRWAADVLPQPDTLPPDAETIWQEGTSAQRLTVLRLVRAEDPARGREWLVAVWKSERADFRADALAALGVGLRLEDEPFLEAALDDRGQRVRAVAVAVLARLPGSAFATRMRERADAMLAYTAPAPARGLRAIARAVTGGTQGQLVATPPEAFDRAWQRDGIEERPTLQIGTRAWWLVQTLAHVPPEHWEERFGVPAGELIAAAERDNWGTAVLDGWTRAAIARRSAGWANLLWEWWYSLETTDPYYRMVATRKLEALIQCLSPDQANLVAERWLADAAKGADFQWSDLLATLPMPWSAALGRRYLTVLRERIRRIRPQTYDVWIRTLPVAARALPPECFGEAMQDWGLPEPTNWFLHEWRRELDRFTETIQTRQRLQRLMEEMA